MADAILPLPHLLHQVVLHWGAQPAVCSGRLLGELRAAGYAVVPATPTDTMVAASLRALRRHGIRWTDPLTETRKHGLRLGDAIRAGQMEILLDLHRAGGGR